MTHAREAAFAERCIPEPNTGCLLWIGDSYPNGYGRFWFEGRSVGAHRVAMRLARGEMPATGAIVLHKCDTPACVNPAHLSTGTQLDNMRDRNTKGRANLPSGETHSAAKLSDAEIKEVTRRLALGERQQDIAHAFGITQSLVSRIKSGHRRSQ